VSLENAMFLFQVAPRGEGIVAHGFNRIGKALFAVYARLADGNQVMVEGTSGQTLSSGTDHDTSLIFKIFPRNFVCIYCLKYL